MINKNKRKTWTYPWSYLEGTIITAAILVLGFIIQAAGNGVILRFAGFPWNLLAGLLFVAVLVSVFKLRQKHPFIKWLRSVKAALPAILGFTLLVLLMGFVKQDVKPQSTIS